ncbi:PAS domain-containing protein, partial [Flavobacteriales bacterium]|nr:PAS domain-containing protein [Flavobacteriales bacterium]
MPRNQPYLNATSAIRILIVEDFHAETEALLMELRDAEMTFEECVVKNEKQYKSSLSSFRPDIILSPYSLKGTNAIKLLGIAKTAKVEAPFILLAFDLSEDIAIDLLGEGIEDYVQQSTLKRLPVAIKKALQRYKTQLELQISEKKLRTSEQSLRSMVRNAPIAVAMFDLNMNYLVVSDVWLKHEKKTEKELIGNNHYSVVPEIPDSWKKVHQEVLQGASHGKDQEKMVRGDGREEVIRWNMNPWYNSEGAIGGAVLFIEDITEKFAIRSALEKNERLLTIGEELGSSGSFEFEIQSETTSWSENMYKIKGFELTADISHENYIKHIHTDDLPSYLETYGKILSFIAPTHFEYRLIRPIDGRTVHLRVHSTFVKNKEGKPIALMGSVQDITHIRKADKALLESESSLKRAQKIAKVGSWALNPDDNSVRWSEELYTIHDIEGRVPTYEFIRSLTHPEDVGLFDKGFQDLSSGINTDFVYRIVTPAGKIKHVRGVGQVVMNKSGKVASMSGTVQDVSK